MDFERAGAWLLHSGIQESSGGVARYYKSDARRNLPVSTEITGYAASAFSFLHALTGNSAYREAAIRAARFLVRSAWDPVQRIFPFELAREGAPLLAYFFDCGIIARGLFEAARCAGDPEFHRMGSLACHSMAAAFFRDGQPVPPVLSLPSGQPLPFEPRWSRSPGCYQLKAATPWLAVEGLEPLYHSTLERALSTHGEFLPGEEDRERVMDRLHAYAYFLEGLLPAAARPDCARALAEGIGRLSGFLLEIAPDFERSDVVAQLLRVRLYAEVLGAVPLDLASAAREAGRIAVFQASSADPRIDGGFYFGRKRGEFLPFVNPVSTAFCLQALAMWQQRQAGTPRVSLDALI